MSKSCIALLVLLFLGVTQVRAEDANTSNTANNPLTAMLGINLQNYYIPSIYGTDKTSNSFLFRGVLPHKTGGTQQIMRATLPYQSVPQFNEENVTGLGDLNVFDIFLLKPKNGFQYGVGPYLIIPTASEPETGAGLWQAGASAVLIKPSEMGLLGALLTYQHSFAGPSERPVQNIATLQPFLIFNLPKGYYARSTGVWNFNMQNGDYYIPVGVGAGKVWTLKSGNILNVGIEPQWTVLHEGDGQPNFQTFIVFNMQFPL